MLRVAGVAFGWSATAAVSIAAWSISFSGFSPKCRMRRATYRDLRPGLEVGDGCGEERRRVGLGFGPMRRVLAALDLSSEMGKPGTSDGSFVSSAALVHVDFEVRAANSPIRAFARAGRDELERRRTSLRRTISSGCRAYGDRASK